MKSKNYHLANIRELLTKGFNEEKLRALCFDEAAFRHVHDRLAENASKTEIVTKLLEFAESTLKIDVLLEWAQEHNPERYQKHQPYELPINSATSIDTNRKSRSARASSTENITPSSNQEALLSESRKTQIPQILIDQIREGRVVLFLGAGASVEAVHPQNKILPTSQMLSEKIAGKFLGSDFSGRPLSQVAELAISETDLFTVQQFIASLFQDFYPSEFHKLIPKFVWSAIATTNFDLIIERAYLEVQDRLQQPVVFKKNGERIEEKLKSLNSLVHLKLHGCITDINDPNIPLILTPDQYVTHKKGRSRLFDRLRSYAYDFPFLFVGHSLGDSDIRAILLELSEGEASKPRSYLLTPNMTPAEVRLWEGKKISHIPMSFKEFLCELNESIPRNFRVLATLSEKPEHPIFKRFIVSDDIKPSQSLMTFLTRDVEFIHKDYRIAEADPKAFYKGYFIDWSPIITNLDVKRSISDDIMSEIFLITEEERSERTEFYLIKGHAGSGKTVILKRLSWDASVAFDKLCLSLKQSSYPEYEALSELYRLCKERIYLLVDPISEYVDKVEEFILKARKEKLPLTIIGVERPNEWNINCDHLETYLKDSYDVKYLSEKEIRELINLLAKHNSLGHLEGMTFEQQMDALAVKAGRQLLVALHEATLGKPFSDIVLDEYNSITSLRARSLYLTVCVFHRLGIPVRAGLISRVHGIPFVEFEKELFKPLEFIVFASRDTVIQDYVYRSRHSHIAEIVFERVLVNIQDRYDEYVRIINAMDIDYSSDRETFKGLTNARKLLATFDNSQMIRQIFDVAKQRIPEEPMLMQQEAIFEMNSPDGSLDRATGILQKAYRIAPRNQVVAHSLSVLARKKAKGAISYLEKNKLREESRMIAQELASKGPPSAHPYHTLIKIGLDELSDLMEQGDEVTIERKIKSLEKNIAQATQSFPEETFILDAEAEFCNLINRHPQALKALEKAFLINKGSPYLTLRLAKMYEMNKEQEKAIQVLKDCLDVIPSDKDVNFKLAMLLSNLSNAKNTEIKHYLRRSFTVGDSNYAAQFQYARFIYLEGEHGEAIEYFKRLGELNIDTRIKKKPQGIVKEDNTPIRYSGTIAAKETSYGFIKRDKYQDDIFTHRQYTSGNEWSKLTPNLRVTFEMAFNYRGPFALNVKIEANVFGYTKEQ